MLSRRFYYSLGLSLLLLSCGDGNLSNQESNLNLIGGQYVKPGQFPATVALVAKSSINKSERTFCTASKIGPKTFLTAAHCVVMASGELTGNFIPGSSIVVAYGPDSVKDKRYNLTIVSAAAHPSYVKSGKAFGTVEQLSDKLREQMVDVGVFTVKEETPEVQTARLVTDTKEIKNAMEKENSIFIGGYGCEERPAKTTGKLKYGKTKVSKLNDGSFLFAMSKSLEGLLKSKGINPNAPAKNDKNIPPKPQSDITVQLSEEEVFKTLIDPKKDVMICPGDSGGPVYLNNGTNLDVIGVNSLTGIHPVKQTDKSKSSDMEIPELSFVSVFARIDDGAPIPAGKWLKEQVTKPDDVKIEFTHKMSCELQVKSPDSSEFVKYTLEDISVKIVNNRYLQSGSDIKVKVSGNFKDVPGLNFAKTAKRDSGIPNSFAYLLQQEASSEVTHQIVLSLTPSPFGRPGMDLDHILVSKKTNKPISGLIRAQFEVFEACKINAL